MPAPGGGATAALHAAQAAALVAMVARYSEGPRFAEHAELVQKIRDAADRLRDEALTLAEDDVAAFTAVTEAYRLPKGDDGESAERAAAIEAATLGAARPPEALVRLGPGPRPGRGPAAGRQPQRDQRCGRGRRGRSRSSDHLPGQHRDQPRGISGTAARAELRAAVNSVDHLTERADKLTSTVRAELTR